jgi:CPA1 family monovalent cation:H+ antiporter
LDLEVRWNKVTPVVFGLRSGHGGPETAQVGLFSATTTGRIPFALSLLETIAVLFTLSAAFGFLNRRYVRLPSAIGLVVISLAGSLVVVLAEALWPGLGLGRMSHELLRSVDFRDVLLNGFLSALLFAGAINVDLDAMRQRKYTILLLTTLGLAISTAIVGSLVWLAARGIGYGLPFTWALVFGALISPTDPVAVLAVMRRVRVPALLRACIAGESLLNDGAAVVLFTVLLAVASASSAQVGTMDALDIFTLFAKEVVGGAMLGLATGSVAFWMMRQLDEHNLEVMLTLALVTGTYALAQRLDVSGPIAVVAAGVLIGNQGMRLAMTKNTREHVLMFWGLIEEILNAVLFLLIGLEVLIIGPSFEHGWLAAAAIPIVLLARLISVSVSVGIPVGLLSRVSGAPARTIAILTWSGLKGGISVALALSIPPFAPRDTLLTATYAVVIFSILVQGLTMERLVTSLFPKKRA